MSFVGDLLGGGGAKDALQSFRPAGFSSAGLSGRFANNRFSVTRGAPTSTALSAMRRGFAERSSAGSTAASGFSALRPQLRSLGTQVAGFTEAGVSSLRQLASELAATRAGLPAIGTELAGTRGTLRGIRGGLSGLRGELSALRGEIRPGMSRLTESRLAGLEADRSRTVGNLREELARRRVAGSSFAAREISAVESEFARQEDLIRAESFLQELGAIQDLLGQEAGIFATEAGIAGQEAGVLGQEAGLAGLNAEMIARQAGFEGEAAQLQQIGTQMIAEFLNAEGGLVAQEFAANADAAMASVESALQTLNQLNLETNLAATLANSSSQQVAANLQAQAQVELASTSLGLDFVDALTGGILTGFEIGGFGE